MFFKDREEAGRILAKKLLELKKELINPIVLGIPRGGVPIGHCIALALNAEFDALVLRKLPVPYSPEVGFGAVTLDKISIVNEPLLAQLALSDTEVKKIIEDVYKEVLMRNRQYRQDKPIPDLSGRSVILTDDGLATGITMLAAIRFVRKRDCGQVIVAAPVAHKEAYEMVKAEADKIIVLHIDSRPFFAVASFYQVFSDMSDEEVIALLLREGCLKLKRRDL